MKIVVASGKGGTGKSMLASSLAWLFSEKTKVVACDCDVDAPNLGLWLGVTTYDSEENISTSEKANIILDKCTECGECFQTCAFGAIEKTSSGFSINPLLCEGCGACQLICPVEAIILEREGYVDKVDKSHYKGVWIIAEHYKGEIHKVAFQLLTKGRELADILNASLTLVVLGDKFDAILNEFGEYGADKVIYVKSNLLKDYP